jgi:hypothetical protein
MTPLWHSHMNWWMSVLPVVTLLTSLLAASARWRGNWKFCPRSFDRKSINLRSCSRASSRSLGWLERSMCHLGAEDLFDTPEPDQSIPLPWLGCDPTADAPSTACRCINQIHAPLHSLEGLTGMTQASGESCQSFAHCGIEVFNERRVDCLASS